MHGGPQLHCTAGPVAGWRTASSHLPTLPVRSDVPIGHGPTQIICDPVRWKESVGGCESVGGLADKTVSRTMLLLSGARRLARVGFSPPTVLASSQLLGGVLQQLSSTSTSTSTSSGKTSSSTSSSSIEGEAGTRQPSPRGRVWVLPMPKLSHTMSQGALSQWNKQAGDRINMVGLMEGCVSLCTCLNLLSAQSCSHAHYHPSNTYPAYQPTARTHSMTCQTCSVMHSAMYTIPPKACPAYQQDHVSGLACTRMN